MQVVEFGCGREMSDVSSMFIVYLLELQTWHLNISIAEHEAVLKDLWPHARLAAEWQMSVSSRDDIPLHLVDTYDVLGLVAYPHSTYSSAFHLLAMLAAEKLAYQMGECCLVPSSLIPRPGDQATWYHAWASGVSRVSYRVFFQGWRYLWDSKHDARKAGGIPVLGGCGGMSPPPPPPEIWLP